MPNLHRYMFKILTFSCTMKIGGVEMSYEFIYDNRLGIELPKFYQDWDDLQVSTQEEVLSQWEIIRGHIPDRIFDLEQEINKKQAELNNEENFQRSCSINSEIAELASVINDLWIWYRTNQSISLDGKPVHA